MALVWKCDRCEMIEDSGSVDDPPEDWERRSLPVRGSQGARSSNTYVICRDCDDDLYRWFHGIERDPHFAASDPVVDGEPSAQRGGSS